MFLYGWENRRGAALPLRVPPLPPHGALHGRHPVKTFFSIRLRCLRQDAACPSWQDVRPRARPGPKRAPAGLLPPFALAKDGLLENTASLSIFFTRPYDEQRHQESCARLLRRPGHLRHPQVADRNLQVRSHHRHCRSGPARRPERCGSQGLQDRRFQGLRCGPA